MNLFEYLESELRPFSEHSFTTVDSVALSQLAMIDGAGIVPSLREKDIERLQRIGGINEAGASMPGSEGTFMHRLFDFADTVRDRAHARRNPGAHIADLLAAERYDTMFTGLDQFNVRHEIAYLAASPRFRVLELRDYVSLLDRAKRVQFSATTYVLPGEWAYVAFRGTDTSFTGWRENFDMAATPPVPAQRMAAAYLELVARHLPERIYVGGHSKGGNLATYAAVRCSDSVRSRISAVYDHDGPGFKKGFMDDAAARRALAELEGRIVRTVPVDSVVGMLMDSCAPERAVVSTASGADQHSVFSWVIDGGDLAYAPETSASAHATHEVMGTWLASFDDDELPCVVEALFATIEASGAYNAVDILSGGPRAAQLIGEGLRNVDQRTRDVLGPAMSRLAAIAAERFARGAARGIAQGIENLLQRGQ